MAQGKRAIDFGMAEALAFGSLLAGGRAGDGSPGRTAGAALSISVTRR